MSKWQRSLRRFSKELGETNAQAVARLSVHECRELARETHALVPSNTGAKAKQKQQRVIFGDSLNVLLIVDSMKDTGRGYNVRNHGKNYWVSREKVLTSPNDVDNWIEMNRTARYGRTPELPVMDRKVCLRTTHAKAMRLRFKKIGSAKGGWLGAGMDIARAQRGLYRVNIGKNFLGYAQKHSRFGSSTHPKEGFKPFAFVTNRSGHSSSYHVLTRGGIRRAEQFALKKTVQWYRRTLRGKNKKR